MRQSSQPIINAKDPHTRVRMACLSNAPYDKRTESLLAAVFIPAILLGWYSRVPILSARGRGVCGPPADRRGLQDCRRRGG